MIPRLDNDRYLWFVCIYAGISGTAIPPNLFQMIGEGTNIYKFHLCILNDNDGIFVFQGQTRCFEQTHYNTSLACQAAHVWL